MTIAIILGTRPEIIKCSPLVRELEARTEPYYVIHTGQHYSFAMDRVFFEDLRLPEPRYHLNVGSGEHGEQTGRMLSGIEKIFADDPPGTVLVQGDTNTVLAGSLVASKSPARLGHVEAGLRSYDRTMPEEVNRVVSDHLSDLLFAPTATARKNLVREGIDPSTVHVTGNTVVDALYAHRELSEERYCCPPSEHPYILITAHRQENVDDPQRLRDILRAMGTLASDLEREVIFPAHPRTVKMMAWFGYAVPPGVRLIDPVGYLQFLQLEARASLIVTDSGGIQEEACLLGVPCVTIRENTERPETVAVGANVLAGTDEATIVAKAHEMLSRKKRWKQPYGDGSSGKRIVELCLTVDTP